MARNKLHRGRTGGTVGPFIFYEMHGNTYVRSKPQRVRNPRSPAQQYNRKKWTRLNRLSSILHPWIRHTFDHPDYKTARGAFLGLNMKLAFRDEKGEPVPDPDRLVVCSGKTSLLETGPFELNPVGEILIRWDPADPSNSLDPHTSIHILLMDEALEIAQFRFSVATLADGETCFPLLHELREKKLQCWVVGVRGEK